MSYLQIQGHGVMRQPLRPGSALVTDACGRRGRAYLNAAQTGH